MPFHRRGKKSLDNWTNSISSREMKWLCFDDKYRLFFYFVVNLGRCNYYRVAATVIFPFPIENSSMVSQWNFFSMENPYNPETETFDILIALVNIESIYLQINDYFETLQSIRTKIKCGQCGLDEINGFKSLFWAFIKHSTISWFLFDVLVIQSSKQSHNFLAFFINILFLDN